MKVSFFGNSVQVVTDIDANLVKNEAVAVFQDEDMVYKVERGREGKFSKYGIVSNTVIDGKLAIIWFEDDAVQKEDFKNKYMAAVESLKVYTEAIKAAAQERSERELAIWEGVFDDEDEPDAE